MTSELTSFTGLFYFKGPFCFCDTVFNGPSIYLSMLSWISPSCTLQVWRHSKITSLDGKLFGISQNCKRPFTNIFYLLPIPNCMRFWSNSRSQKITFICSCIAQISRGWSQLITAVTFTLWIINLFSPTVGPLSDICLRFTKMYGILHE